MSSANPLTLLLAIAAGYLLGSIPMGVLLARWLGWPDPRYHGSGHTGALNVSRGAGLVALFVVGAADVLKGLAAVGLASQLSANPWAVAGAGIAAVAGHNWPVWLGFSGGMGLSASAGALVMHAPLAILITGIVLLAVRLLVIKHSPRAVIASMAAVPPLLILLHVPAPTFWLAVGCAALIALRYTSNWNRVYP